MYEKFAIIFSFLINYLDSTTDVLLVESNDIVAQLENIRSVVLGEAMPSAQNTTPSMERSSADNQYVSPYRNPHFYWEKCFPVLYPYGRGGPSDPFFQIKKLRDYHRHVLRRGGGKDGRRFQNNPGHIFATYTYEVKRRVGNMAYAATRDDTADTNTVLTSKAVVGTLVECLRNSTEDEPLDIDILYERSKSSVPTSTSGNSITASDECGIVNDTVALGRVKGLVQRLVPFAKQAPGTPMHMSFERKNMLAMIMAPVIVNHACWRWFATYTYSDLYESRVYEIVVPMIGDIIEYADREKVVCEYDKKMRTKILRAHPALVARVFHEKQECLWQYVLCGTDHPLGVIEDYMRRVEVRDFILFCMHMLQAFTLYTIIFLYSFKRVEHHMFMLWLQYNMMTLPLKT